MCTTTLSPNNKEQLRLGKELKNSIKVMEKTVQKKWEKNMSRNGNQINRQKYMLDFHMFPYLSDERSQL